MKGIVFTTLMDLVEAKFGLEVVDFIISNSKLKSGGAYTNVGTYDHDELLSLLTQLSIETQLPVKTLLDLYAQRLLKVFVDKYVGFFAGKNLFTFLKSIDNYVHVEVRKLYPEAELPQFKFSEPDSNTLVMEYTSEKPFADLAEGLLKAAVVHFKENVSLNISAETATNPHHRLFTLIKNGNANEQ